MISMLFCQGRLPPAGQLVTLLANRRLSTSFKGITVGAPWGLGPAHELDPQAGVCMFGCPGWNPRCRNP